MFPDKSGQFEVSSKTVFERIMGNLNKINQDLSNFEESIASIEALGPEFQVKAYREISCEKSLVKILEYISTIMRYPRRDYARHDRQTPLLELVRSPPPGSCFTRPSKPSYRSSVFRQDCPLRTNPSLKIASSR